MLRKLYTPEKIAAKLRQLEVLTAQDSAIADGARALGITEATFRWPNEFGGLKTGQSEADPGIGDGRICRCGRS